MFESFGHLLGRKMRGAGTARKLKAAVVIAAALEVFKARGPVFADVRVISYKDGTLKLEGGGSAAAQEISLRAPELIEAMNAKLKAGAMSKIVVFS